jgi:uncharacterized membrane protein YbhN (UPF0104 family)
VTLVLAGVGLVLAIGRYPIGAYLWIELVFVVAMVAAAFVFFSRAVRRRLVFLGPVARRLRVEKPARAVYDGLHGYRDHSRTMLVVSLVTAGSQLIRVVAIYASGRAVGIHLSLLPYIVLGPLLFLGSAMLYGDQTARVGSRRRRVKEPRDADLHPPVDADAAGGSDAQVES